MPPPPDPDPDAAPDPHGPAGVGAPPRQAPHPPGATLTELGRALPVLLARLVRLDIALVVASARDVAVFAGRGTVLMLAGTLVGIVGLILLLYGLGQLLALLLPGWLLAVLGGALLLAAAVPVTWRSWRALTG